MERFFNVCNDGLKLITQCTVHGIDPRVLNVTSKLLRRNCCNLWRMINICRDLIREKWRKKWKRKTEEKNSDCAQYLINQIVSSLCSLKRITASQDYKICVGMILKAEITLSTNFNQDISINTSGIFRHSPISEYLDIAIFQLLLPLETFYETLKPQMTSNLTK